MYAQDVVNRRLAIYSLELPRSEKKFYTKKSRNRESENKKRSRESEPEKLEKGSAKAAAKGLQRQRSNFDIDMSCVICP